MLALWVEPAGLRHARLRLHDLIRRNISSDVRAGVFYEDLPDLTLYAEQTRGGRWRQVLISDRTDPQAPLLALADAGRLEPAGAGGGMRLVLERGELHREEPSAREYVAARFASAEITLGLGQALSDRNRLVGSPFELGPGEILARARQAQAQDPGGALRWRTFLHRRIAAPLAVLAFALLAVPIGALRRGGRAFGYAASLVAVIVYYALLRTGEGLSQRGALPALAGAAPAQPGGGGARRAALPPAGAQRAGLRPMTLFLHLARRALVAFVGALLAVVLVFLVVDFAENAAAYRGPGWVEAVLELYLHRSAIVAYQTAPAAMLLAAALTASDLRRTREYTAMRALGLGPWRTVLPVLAVAGAVSAGLLVLEDEVVVHATARAEAIMADRFHRSGGFQRGRETRRWFRGANGRRIYHLRGGAEGTGFERVTILDVTPEFKLARRIDAARMTPGEEPGAWLLSDGDERRFDAEGRVTTEPFMRRSYHFDEAPGAFDVRPGRPAQQRRAVLGQQAALRARLGLPSREYELELQQRLAYPLASVPAALVALGLALRRERKGHFTAALMESVSISFVFWGLQGACLSFGLAGRLTPVMAAWLPDLVFAAAGLLAVRRWA